MTSILIVDDDPTIRAMFGRALQSLGEVEQAANGADALRLLGSKKYSVVLLDLHMPVIDGFVILHTLATKPGPNRETRDEQLTWPVPEVDERLFSIEPEGAGWRVRGKKIERLISMTNFAQSESLMRIQRVLQASGISNALVTAGVQEGDTVYIEKAALTWADQE